MQDSLAAEIEGTMRRELSVEEETVFEDQRLNTQMSHQNVGGGALVQFPREEFSFVA